MNKLFYSSLFLLFMCLCFTKNSMACTNNNACGLVAIQKMDFKTNINLTFAGSLEIKHENEFLSESKYTCKWTGTNCSDSNAKTYSQWWILPGTKRVTLYYTYVCNHKVPIGYPDGVYKEATY